MKEEKELKLEIERAIADRFPSHKEREAFRAGLRLGMMIVGEEEEDETGRTE